MHFCTVITPGNFKARRNPTGFDLSFFGSSTVVSSHSIGLSACPLLHGSERCTVGSQGTAKILKRNLSNNS